MLRTYAVINAEIAEFEQELIRLRKEAAEAHAREVGEAKKRIADIMKESGLTPEDVINPKADKSSVVAFKAKDKTARTPREPIYKDPVSGKTWNGLGRCPEWLLNTDREQFRIPKAA